MNDTQDNQDLDQQARTQAALAAQARAREVAAGIAQEHADSADCDKYDAFTLIKRIKTLEKQSLYTPLQVLEQRAHFRATSFKIAPVVCPWDLDTRPRQFIRPYLT